MSLATSGTATPSAQERTLSLVAVIASAFISTLTFAITTPLLALRLAGAGLSGGWIGLNTGAGAAAILLVSMVTPSLGRRLGVFRALMLSILVMALGVGLLPVARDIKPPSPRLPRGAPSYASARRRRARTCPGPGQAH